MLKRMLLLALIVAAGCRKPGPSTAVHIDPALATMVPADTQVLVGTRLDKLKATPLYQKRFAQAALPGLDQFARETGLDPRKDVWELLFASNGKDTGVLMVRGRFSPVDMEPKLERQGATRTRYKSYSLFGDDKRSMFFMNQSTALAGSTGSIQQIIDNLDSGANGIPPVLLPLVKELPAGSQFWAVFNGVLVDMPFREGTNLGNINNMIRSVDHGWVSADLTRGLDLRASGMCKSEESARQIHDALRGIIGLGRLNTPDSHPELLKAFDGIKVDQQGRALKVVADVAQDTVDSVLDVFTGSRR